MSLRNDVERTIVLNDIDKKSNEDLLKNLSNMRKERDQYKKHVEHHEYIREANVERLDLMKKLSNISDVKNRRIAPLFEFERDSEWLSLQSKLLMLNSRVEQKKIADEIDALSVTISKSNDEIARFDAAIPIIEKELASRGVTNG